MSQEVCLQESKDRIDTALYRLSLYNTTVQCAKCKPQVIWKEPALCLMLFNDFTPGCFLLLCVEKWHKWSERNYILGASSHDEHAQRIVSVLKLCELGIDLSETLLRTLGSTHDPSSTHQLIGADVSFNGHPSNHMSLDLFNFIYPPKLSTKSLTKLDPSDIRR